MSRSKCIYSPRRPFPRIETETVIHSDSDFATVAFLRIRRASLEPKQEQAADPAVPAPLDPPYLQVAEYIQAGLKNNGQAAGRIQPQICTKRASGIPSAAPTLRCLDNWISVGSIHRDLRDASDMPLEAEVRECFHILQSGYLINQLRGRRLANFGTHKDVSRNIRRLSLMSLT